MQMPSNHSETTVCSILFFNSLRPIADITFRLYLLGSAYKQFDYKRLVQVMSKKIEINQPLLKKNLSSLDPLSEHFSFELWAAKVSQQMKSALEIKSK